MMQLRKIKVTDRLKIKIYNLADWKLYLALFEIYSFSTIFIVGWFCRYSNRLHLIINNESDSLGIEWLYNLDGILDLFISTYMSLGIINIFFLLIWFSIRIIDKFILLIQKIGYVMRKSSHYLKLQF